MEERTCIGIIAEFDPFHRGHAHLIAQAKAALPGAPVVCAMSGPFTQRGEAAIVSKYARAEMAVRCGADLVVELPVQWAVSSAESFARGGVQILHALGVTHLAFGSESGDLTALQIVAQALDSAAFPDALRPYLQQGLPFALRLPQQNVPRTEAACGITQTMRSAVEQIAKQYGVERVWAFGSRARNAAKEGSDLDLRVDKGDMRGLEIGGFVYDLEQLIGVPVDVSTTSSLSEDFRASIKKDEVLLYERERS